MHLGIPGIARVGILYSPVRYGVRYGKERKSAIVYDRADRSCGIELAVRLDSPLFSLTANR